MYIWEYFQGKSHYCDLFEGLKISDIRTLENENEQHYCSSSISTEVSSCFTVLQRIGWSRWKGGRTTFLGGAGSRDSTRNFLGSGTNVTGEPHQSAPQRFDYCQKRQQGGKKIQNSKRKKKGYQLEATLQSCRGRERSERLSCDREKELLLHNTSPPVGLYYLFLILFFSKDTSNNTAFWTFKVFHRENKPYTSYKRLTRVFSDNEWNTWALFFCSGLDLLCLVSGVKVVFDVLSESGSVNSEAEEVVASPSASHLYQTHCLRRGGQKRTHFLTELLWTPFFFSFL